MEKYGFVYIWLDRKRKKFYIGCHWGNVDDGYICSSGVMLKAYKRRPQDFKRRILATDISVKSVLLDEEYKWLSMIKPHELKTKYYNLHNHRFNHWSSKSNDPAKKSGETRRGSKIGSNPEKNRKISQAKKGVKFSPEHREKLRQAKLGKKQTESQKQKRSESLKLAWATGNRPRKKPSMSPQDQTILSSNRLKKLWSDPVWAAAQREKLRIGSKHRHLNKSKQTEEAA